MLKVALPYDLTGRLWLRKLGVVYYSNVRVINCENVSYAWLVLNKWANKEKHFQYLTFQRIWNVFGSTWPLGGASNNRNIPGYTAY